jgi:hypothetical protein
MNTKLPFFMIFAVIALMSCANDDLPPPPAAGPLPPVVNKTAGAPQKLAPARFVYRGDRHRDPFVPLTGDGVAVSSPEEVVTPNIGALTLKGIIDDGKQKIALISSGATTYVLRGSRLYDNRQRLVRGITGAIKRDSVVMIGADKTTKEIKLREK